MDKTILRKWLKAGFIDKDILHATQEGTPQGGICSPVLANMTLDGLEKKLREKFPKPPRKSSKEKINFVRFADDFLFTGKSKEVARKRGQTSRGNLHERTGTGTLTRENPHHPH